MEIYGLIYKITNKLDGMVYVGQTTNTIEYRFNVHCKEKRDNRHFSNALRKHGKENFVVEEIAKAYSKDHLNELEVYYVEFFNSFHPEGYNFRAGGNQNGKCSDITKKRISDAKKGVSNKKRQGEERNLLQRFKISRGLNGKYILATEIATNNKIIYTTVNETRLYGFQPWNVVGVCKGSAGRTQHKGWKFEYLNYQDNQSGSEETKISSHAQRIEGEPCINTEYNPSTSHRQTK